MFESSQIRNVKKFVVFVQRESLRAAPQFSKSKLQVLLELINSTFGSLWQGYEGVDRVKKVISKLADQIDSAKAADGPTKSNNFLVAVDRVTATISAFDVRLP